MRNKDDGACFLKDSNGEELNFIAQEEFSIL